MLRLGLAGLLFYSAFEKTKDLYGFGLVLESYELLPAAWIQPAAVLLPLLEWVFAAGLLWPPAARAASIAVMALALLFGAVLVSRWGQELPYGCGCFGPGEAQTVGWGAIAKDVLLFLGGLASAAAKRKSS
jgi:uncharacterized membrane protein YphA (DoxX/SURF4 family)